VARQEYEPGEGEFVVLGNEIPVLDVPAQKGNAPEQPGGKVWLYDVANNIENITTSRYLLFIRKII
jgi:hypothetical protein